ncbi:MAG: glycosyltransferase [Flavobacteriales bacterium]|nr:glycosyltransferase [Flavobacteriales bacterium]
MMHVLFLPKWYPNEYDPFDGNFIENHAHAIKRKVNVSVLFVHSEANCPTTYRFEKRENKGIQELLVFFKKPNTGINPLNKLIAFFRYKKAQKLGYQRLFKENSKPDLVHIHVLSRPAFLALWLKQKFAIPFVITEHWTGYLESNGKYRGFLKKKFTEYVVKNANRVHTVSTQLKEAMISHHLINQYEIIPNVVDTEIFKPIDRHNEVPEIIFVGNLLQTPKRILDIIQAMKSLKDAGENFHLSIYGEGKDESKAKQLVNKLNLAPEISFKGTANREEIGKAMASADFLILFSSFENQPCVIAEAHAAGIPIIVPDLPGISELMKPELGIIVKTNDQVDFEKALLLMVQSYKSYNTASIRKYGLQLFGEEEIANRFLQFYQTALKMSK